MMHLPPLADDAAAVVIPALLPSPHLARAVASALAQDGVQEVVVAAGGPEEAVRELSATLPDDPRVRVVPNPSGRTPDALNVAIDATSAEVVVRLDAHAELPPAYVATARATLSRTGAANVGGRQVPEAPGGFAAAVAIAMLSPLGTGGATYRSGGEPGPTDTVYLGVFRRSALTAVGGFDPRFPRNQDGELNIRLRRAGYTVWFDPDLAVSYEPRGDLRALARQYWEYGRWRRLTGRIHRGSLRLRQLAAPTLVVGLVGTLGVGVATGSALLPVAAWAAYLGALLVEGVRASRSAVRGPGVALALAAMHLSWGAGFLVGPPSDD